MLQELALVLPGRLEREAHMKTIIDSAGAVASSVRLGSHTLVFDQPATVPGGGDLGPSPLDARAQIVGVLHRRRHIAQGEEDNVAVRDPRELQTLLQSVTGVLTTLLAGVAPSRCSLRGSEHEHHARIGYRADT